MDMKYCIDTSSLIDAHNRYYPPDVFPKWWSLFQETVQEGIVKTSQAVLLELEKKEDTLHKWVKSQKDFIIPLFEDIQIESRNILERFPRLVDTRKQRSEGDPFVIASAKVTNTKVITSENYTRNLEKPNIPDVCIVLNIPCLSLLDFMRDMCWHI